ncbi:MAG: endonuclease/exonuclease/phosphatase family protein [Treponema sp.]|nr:endonuclease/exonuclease/phosphatase family protein [Treponema sp.]
MCNYFKSYFITFIFLVMIFTLFLSCQNQTSKIQPESSDLENKEYINIVNWNLQTFFDCQTLGNEYSDFQNASKWSKDKYLTRLSNLCQVITSLDADLYVFEEIENDGILYDISNQLAGRSWDLKDNWNYAAFAGGKDSCIGLGILSKYPLSDLKSHSLDIRVQGEEQPSLRPILQVKVQLENKSLILLANHWKSKLGGKEETEIWRDWQEFALAKIVDNILNDDSFDQNCKLLICGDFNRDIGDFIEDLDIQKSGNIYLRGFSRQEGEKSIELYSPWYFKSGLLSDKIGSYYYQDSWSRIDNFFLLDSDLLLDFSVKAEDPWADENNIPNSYKIYTGQGFSDHLPIYCRLGL